MTVAEATYRSHPDALDAWSQRRDELFTTLLSPPPRLTVSEWADQHRVLSPESSAEPGPWKTDRVPYLRGIMDAISDPAVRRVVVMSASQVGKTEIVNNMVGYYVAEDPAPILVVQPSDRMGEAWSKDRLSPMIRDSKAIRAKIPHARSRDSGNTILHKRFPGGHLTITGANSAAGLASRPIQILGLDEVDRFPASAGSEGDPVSLAEQRTTTFWNRKILYTSTPTTKGLSRIETLYALSDQRRYYVPCPDCGHDQILLWKNVQWEKEEANGRTIHHPDTAAYCCESCGSMIEEYHKTDLLLNGEWVVTHPDGRYPGFQISALYSPWVTWAELAVEWLAKQGDDEQMKTFVNLKLGELWEERGQTVDPGSLASRAETYVNDEGEPVDVPHGVGVLTVAADVQGDRIEVQVLGVGADWECWVIHHERIYGDPELQETWTRVTPIITKPYRHASGRTMRIAAGLVDAGYLTDTVYAYTRHFARMNIHPSMGDAGKKGAPPVKIPVRKNKHGVKLVTLGTFTIKNMLLYMLRVQRPGPRYVHLLSGLDAEYHAQLCSEAKRRKRAPGGRYFTERFEKTREQNEAWDLMVMNLGSVHVLGPTVIDNLALWAERMSEPPPEEPETEAGGNQGAGPRSRRGRNGWVTGWDR